MKTRKILLQYFVVFFIIVSCKSENQKSENEKNTTKTANLSILTTHNKKINYNGNHKTIHIFVALCDNKYQGIVPVPESIGNGQDPDSNLYWGARYGVKTFFKRSNEWQLLKSKKVNDTILERLIFKHKKKNFYLVADAYNGKNIKETVIDFLKSVSGNIKDTLFINNKTIGINGNASLLGYVGHDGLMDFSLNETFINVDNKKRDAIILACFSKEYFSKHILDANANPLVWTSGLMAPEAYIIHDAISAYINNNTDEQIRLRAAKAYSKYQKCSLRAANNLLVKGF